MNEREYFLVKLVDFQTLKQSQRLGASDFLIKSRVFLLTAPLFYLQLFGLLVIFLRYSRKYSDSFRAIYHKKSVSKLSK